MPSERSAGLLKQFQLLFSQREDVSPARPAARHELRALHSARVARTALATDRTPPATLYTSARRLRSIPDTISLATTAELHASSAAKSSVTASSAAAGMRITPAIAVASAPKRPRAASTISNSDHPI